MCKRIFTLDDEETELADDQEYGGDQSSNFLIWFNFITMGDNHITSVEFWETYTSG